MNSRISERFVRSGRRRPGRRRDRDGGWGCPSRASRSTSSSTLSTASSIGLDIEQSASRCGSSRRLARRLRKLRARHRRPRLRRCRCRTCARAVRSRYRDAWRHRRRDSRGWRYARLHAAARRQRVDQRQFGFGLAVEAVDAARSSAYSIFLRGLADAGEHDLRRDRRRPCSTRNSSPPETMSKPAPAPASSVSMAEIRVRLDGVADGVRNVAERLVIGAIAVEDRAARIDVARRSARRRYRPDARLRSKASPSFSLNGISRTLTSISVWSSVTGASSMCESTSSKIVSTISCASQIAVSLEQSN